MEWLRTSGASVVTEDGSPVLLRGVGIGGWLPGFDPYPFGARRYVEQLVLSICFAEPLADEFAGSFADADDAELVALGECFAFRNCVPDKDLCDLVSGAISGAIPGAD